MEQIPVDIEKKLKAVIRRIEAAAVFDGVECSSFNDSTSLKALVKVSGMSERSLREWFKVYTGQKISRYVSKRRAEYAARIFRLFPDTSKSDVSRIIGLSNTQSLYPLMSKNGIAAIDRLRGTDMMHDFKYLNFRYDRLPDCVMFYTLNEIIYKKCSSNEYEIENWDKIGTFIKNKFPGAIVIGDIGFAIDKYIENREEEGIFISGILCKNVSMAQLSPDIIGEFGWLLLPGKDYAVFIHNGEYNDLSDTYFSGIHTLRQNNIQIDKSHLIMEKYLNSPIDTAVEELLTEIWIPIIRY